MDSFFLLACASLAALRTLLIANTYVCYSVDVSPMHIASDAL